MSAEIENFIQFIETAKTDLNVHRQCSFELNCNALTLDIIDKVISSISKLEDKVKQGELKINYLNQFQSNIESILSTLHFRGQPNSSFLAHQDEQWKSHFKNDIEQNSLNVSVFH